MSDILTKTYYGNTVQDWAIALGIMIASIIVAKVAYFVFSRFLKGVAGKTKTNLDDIIIDMIEEPIAVAIVLAGIWYGFKTLNASEAISSVAGNALQFVVILNIAWLLTRVFDALFEEYLVPLADKTETDLDDQILPIVRRGTKVGIWVLGVIIALDNAGYDVGAALAGLGIGGLALAMAGRDTVANVFGGLTVFMDQPFTLNDRVKIAGFDGNIREIGLRSTRLQTLEGRWVTIPNSTFTDSPVENVSREPTRKVVSTLGLTYDMSADQMKKAMEILRELADGHEGINDETKVAFSGFGDFSMNILFIYYIVKDADILQTQTDINLAILERFGEAGLDMAFPTQTILHQPVAA